MKNILFIVLTSAAVLTVAQYAPDNTADQTDDYQWPASTHTYDGPDDAVGYAEPPYEYGPPATDQVGDNPYEAQSEPEGVIMHAWNEVASDEEPSDAYQWDETTG